MFARIGLVFALSLGLAATAPNFAAPAAAQSCENADRGNCESDQFACLRECSDLTFCARKCCEAFHECLAFRGCEFRGPPCPN